MDGIPDIFQFLNYLDFLRGEPATYLVTVTAAIILVVRDWRWSLLALLIQYLIAGLLYVDVLDPRLAYMKVIVGMFVCLILYITARQVNWGKLPVDVTPEEVVQISQNRFLHFGPAMLATTTIFRLVLALMIILAAWVLVQQQIFQLPVVPEHFNLAIFTLIGLGLTGLGLTTEPLKAGMGLFTFLTGFGLFYSALEQSAAMVAMLAIAGLTLSIAIAYLTQARHAITELLD
jgi:hypothetical protein